MKYKFTEEKDFKIVRSSNKNKTSSDAKQPKVNTLSDQALGAVMMALQNSLMHQTDIVPVLKGMKFAEGEGDELVVLNPPVLRVDQKNAEV